ncbi:DUF1152 domain-containing protein [Streptosporangium sp. NBC_01495]|uniref:DUF1152 domain-containing protein n=1 Tax=Streptosporangium sp. NBC_01495 TaxID=2903899 RepID=UPI002E315C55|nr:DUF1152 domain-containing protein [Streptosporangium sp. NBC_01495]
MVAAGGGGDVLGALLLRGLLIPQDPVPLIATYAWERLRLDPSPGPRGLDGFVGLGQIGSYNAEVFPTSDTIPPGRSTLPRLAAEASARLFVLDPQSGIVGLTLQLKNLVDSLQVEKIVLVDIGGDVVASGSEPGLLSPLADAMSLAACTDLGVDAEVVVAGPGLDGELDSSVVLELLQRMTAVKLGDVQDGDVRHVESLLTWHPSEATALLSAAALGIRGTVEVRRKGNLVTLTGTSSSVWRADAQAVIRHSLLVPAIQSTRTLAEVDEAVARIAYSELEYERKKAQSLKSGSDSATDDQLVRLMLDYAADASSRDIDYITMRRLAEAIGMPSLDAVRIKSVLRATGALQLRGPLLNVRRQA